jgi:hypothetical protein
MMTRTRKIVRFAMLSLGAILLVVAGWLWLAHELTLGISRIRFNSAPLEMALMKAASDVFVVKRPDPKPASLSGGYLVAYQRDPDAFRKDAKLLDAWLASAKLGVAALKNTPRGNWVRSSADANYVASRDRVDPWRHTFCLLRRDEDVLVVSGGPEAPSSPECRDIRLDAKDLAELPHGKLLESPAGYLVLVVGEAHTHQSN